MSPPRRRLPDVIARLDRDYTVDLDPHPEHRAAPLAWVQAWAHEADRVDVWATGNRLLAREARVPDRTTAGAVWNRCHDDDVIDAHDDADGELCRVHPEWVDSARSKERATPSWTRLGSSSTITTSRGLRATRRPGPTRRRGRSVIGADGTAPLPQPPADGRGADQSTVDDPVAFHRPAPVRAVDAETWEHPASERPFPGP